MIRPSARPLRVLHVTPRYSPDVGGTETHVREVCGRLSRRPDIDVTVLCTDRTGLRPRYEAAAGFPLMRRRAWPKKRDYYLAPGLARVVRRGQWDVVHIQGIHTLVPIVAMAAARRAGTPYVVTFHTGGHSSGVRSTARGLQWRILAPLLRGAAKLVAVSRFERDLFAQATGIAADEIALVQNGGGLPLPSTDVTRVAGRIVSTGRLERYKGHHRAIAALPHVQSQVPEAHLHILGEGPYEAQLRSLADRLGVADSVTIRSVAPADRSEMARTLGEAAVVVALSDYEAHPVAVMEAVAAGVPVIGYEVAGVGDLVKDGLVAGLRPQSSAAETGGAVAGVMLGPKASVTADLPTWDGTADELARIYRSVVVDRFPSLSR